jgi:glucokinase
MTTELVAGIDLGGSHVSVVIATVAGEIEVRHGEPVDRHAGPPRHLDQIAALIRRATAGTPGRLRAVAIGCPGIIDHRRGVVRGAANLDRWQDVPVREALEQTLSVPVRVENDVNLGALGEGWRGAARGMRDYVFVALGTGTGGGVVANGQLVRGRHGYGGEIAYLVAEPSLIGPGFAGIGNLEAFTGTPALQRLAAAIGIDGGPEALFAAAAGGNAEARRVVDDTIRRLAAAIANIAAVLDPEAIIIGGGLSRQADALFGPLRTVVTQIAGPPVRILPAELGTDAQVMGAVYAAMELWQSEHGDASRP